VPAIGPNTEHIRTVNGTMLRNALGWTWLCDHCHHTFSVGVLPDSSLDLQQLADSLDVMHWCEHTREQR